jgi:hypothetical protein
MWRIIPPERHEQKGRPATKASVGTETCLPGHEHAAILRLQSIPSISRISPRCRLLSICTRKLANERGPSSAGSSRLQTCTLRSDRLKRHFTSQTKQGWLLQPQMRKTCDWQRIHRHIATSRRAPRLLCAIDSENNTVLIARYMGIATRILPMLV